MEHTMDGCVTTTAGRLRRVGFVIALISLHLVSRVDPLGAQTATASAIEGVVVGRESGRAVEGAVVSVEGSGVSTTTNAIGRFRISDVTPGATVLVVKATGFLDMPVPAVTVLAGETTSITVELELTPNYMERVQVTARKTAEQIGDIAAQADVVERATIDSRGDQTLTQAVSRVPGALVSTQLGIFESVTLRGLPRGDPEFTNTLLLIDGVPQTLSNNGARVVALPITDAGSIEVVRGPNSALYGRTAIGGAINVRTEDPTSDHQFAGEFTGGELEMVKGIAKASGPLAPWGGYYVSATTERGGGYFVDKTSDDFETNLWALFGKVTFAPDNRSFGSVSMNYADSDNSTPTNEPVVEGRLLHELEPGFDRFTNLNIPGPNYHQDEARLTANYTRWLASWTRMVALFGYRNVQHKFIDDGDFIGSPYDLEANTLSMYPFSQQLDEDILYQEVRFELTPSLPMKSLLLIGGSYEWTGGSLFSDFIYNDPDLFGFTINYLNPVIPPRSEWQHDVGNREYHLGVTGIFGQWIVEPTSRLVLAMGGRYDRLDLDNSRNGGATIEDSFDAFSPKLSATFRLLSDGSQSGSALNIYGAYSQSFLPPRRPSSLIPDEVPLNLQPEEIVNYEAGVKGGLLHGRVSFEATYFWMTEDGVVLSTRQGPFFVPTNAGELRYKGVETGVGFTVTPRVSLYLNASFYRNRFGDFVIETEDGDTDLTGHRLPMSPDHIVNWGATFRATDSVDATFSVKHVGDVQTNRSNTFELDPYALVDAAVSWRRGPVRLTLSGHNLFDEEYYWNSDGDTADPGRPRQVLFTTAFVFK